MATLPRDRPARIGDRAPAAGGTETGPAGAAQQGDGPATGRAVTACGRDPAADRWTIALWSATADLHCCRYFYREEGAYDAGGRWRRQRISHCIVGRPANQVRAAALAAHFCTIGRDASRAYAGERSAHARRSFQGAFSARLVARLRTALADARSTAAQDVHAQEDAANDALLAMEGIETRPSLGRADPSSVDRAAARQGRAVADNVSLVLRTGPGRPSQGTADKKQMLLPF